MSNITRRDTLAAMTMGTVAALFAGSSRADAAASSGDALSLLSSDQKFSYWVQTLKFADLAGYFAANGKFTAFVPSNIALSKYPRVLAEVTRVDDDVVSPDSTNQAEFVRAHVVPGLHPLSDLLGKVSRLLSIAETPITIDGTLPGSYKVTWVSVDWLSATTRISNTPIIASNALLYPFDNVILG